MGTVLNFSNVLKYCSKRSLKPHKMIYFIEEDNVIFYLAIKNMQVTLCDWHI